ncbi:hypothetical protein KR038_000798, partial [Drosophila bunnanda]
YASIIISGLWKGSEVKSDCEKDVSFHVDLHCGILPECYQSASNAEVLDIFSCERKEKGLPGI